MTIKVENAQLLLSEDRIVIRDLKEHASIATLYRWATRGCFGADGKRYRLETIQIGGRRWTSRQAFDRFVANLSRPGESFADLPQQSAAPRFTPDAARAAHNQALLAADGIR